MRIHYLFEKNALYISLNSGPPEFIAQIPERIIRGVVAVEWYKKGCKKRRIS